jgi:hypothetical protein
MEWFGDKFYGPIVVGVRDLEKALAWYEAFLDLVRQPTHENEAYVGLAFHVREIPVIELYCVPPGQTFVGKRPILFTKNLEQKTRGVGRETGSADAYTIGFRWEPLLPVF